MVSGRRSRARARVVAGLLLLGAMLGNQSQAKEDPPPPPVVTYPYSITPINTTPLGAYGGGYGASVPTAIDSAGRVTGYFSIDSGSPGYYPIHSFLFAGGVSVDIAPSAGILTKAYGINDGGQIVGQVWNGSNSVAFVQSSGVMQSDFIPGVGGNGSTSSANGINAGGDIVGWRYVSGSVPEAFFLAANGSQPMYLGTLGGSSGSEALAINDSDQIVGWASTITGGKHAFLYSSNSMVDLGVLSGYDASFAADINSSGVVVGELVNNLTNQREAFMYSGTTLMGLGDLGVDYSRARGINDLGEIVGYATVSTATGSEGHGFIYRNGVMTDLNSLVDSTYLTITDAVAINNAGQIAAIARSGAVSFAVLLTPNSTVPEPPSAVLMMLGLCLLTLAASLRSRSQTPARPT